MDTYSYLSVSTRSTKIGSSHGNMGCDTSVGVGGAGGGGGGVGNGAGQVGGASPIGVPFAVTGCPAPAQGPAPSSY
jgi:hypothetical protein